MILLETTAVGGDRVVYKAFTTGIPRYLDRSRGLQGLAAPRPVVCSLGSGCLTRL